MRSSLPVLPTPNVEPDEVSGIDIADVLRILGRRWMALGTVFIILFAAGIGIVGALPKRYTGEAVLILEMARAKAVDVKTETDQVPLDRAVINSELDVFRSRSLAEQVVDKLGL